MTEKSRLAIRDATLFDGGVLAGLLGELGYPKAKAFVDEKLKQFTRNKNDRVFVAVYGGKVVGFASCHIMQLMHEECNLCRVTALVVAQAYRRRSIGRRLMAMVENYAQKSGCGRIEITSGQRRHDAHVFYDHMGYTEASRRFLKVLKPNEA
jgi:GNAT superfamily N-acetyltransferase